MHSNLFLRIVSALILVPLVLIPILYGEYVYNEWNIPLYPMLLAVMGTILAWEWGDMFQKKGSSSQLVIALTAAFTVFLTQANPMFALWIILMGTSVVFCLTRHVKYALGTAYICLPLLSMGYIYYINESISREIILWLIFVVWATDIGGFVVGKTVGGPKLAPKISAKKTWSGLIGAILFAMGVAYVFSLYLRAHDLITQDTVGMTNLLVLSAGFLAVVSQIGDFFESAIKRKLGLKDSSNLIPGHGGLFDRVDGLMFAACATAWVLAVFNSGWFE